jgi:acylphosphatase
MKHVLVTYTGRVQGVGFRATARQIARNFKVSGWVKNLSSGGVELVIAAEEAEIEAYLKAIRDSHLGQKIDREVTEPYNQMVKGDFDIRY